MRRLSAEEEALWRRVVESVRPLGSKAEFLASPQEGPPARAKSAPAARAGHSKPAVARPGTTLDASWDRRLARGEAEPDFVIDLHGHNLATAYDFLDRALARGISHGLRVILLVTGNPPRDDHRPGARGAIRAAVGDWLAASPHASSLAAVRPAHPRHGGRGALYIILRRQRLASPAG
jgi:DNA-nicking Smr family endonuclease